MTNIYGFPEYLWVQEPLGSQKRETRMGVWRLLTRANKRQIKKTKDFLTCTVSVLFVWRVSTEKLWIAGQTVQQVNTLSTKPDDRNLIPSPTQ